MSLNINVFNIIIRLLLFIITNAPLSIGHWFTVYKKDGLFPLKTQVFVSADHFLTMGKISEIFCDLGFPRNKCYSWSVFLNLQCTGAPTRCSSSKKAHGLWTGSMEHLKKSTLFKLIFSGFLGWYELNSSVVWPLGTILCLGSVFSTAQYFWPLYSLYGKFT